MVSLSAVRQASPELKFLGDDSSVLRDMGKLMDISQSLDGVSADTRCTPLNNPVQMRFAFSNMMALNTINENAAHNRYNQQKVTQADIDNFEEIVVPESIRVLSNLNQAATSVLTNPQIKQLSSAQKMTLVSKVTSMINSNYFKVRNAIDNRLNQIFDGLPGNQDRVSTIHRNYEKLHGVQYSHSVNPHKLNIMEAITNKSNFLYNLQYMAWNESWSVCNKRIGWDNSGANDNLTEHFDGMIDSLCLPHRSDSEQLDFQFKDYSDISHDLRWLCSNIVQRTVSERFDNPNAIIFNDRALEHEQALKSVLPNDVVDKFKSMLDACANRVVALQWDQGSNDGLDQKWNQSLDSVKALFNS